MTPAVTLREAVPDADGLTVSVWPERNSAEISVGVFGSERFTVPEKPFTLETVITEVCEDPRVKVRLVGLGVTAKSGAGTLKVPVMNG